MRHNYVGDIADFAKYGFLRQFCGTPEQPDPQTRLGIIWYLRNDQNDHGREIRYLVPSPNNRSIYRTLDPPLYAELQRIVGRSIANDRERCILDIQRSQVIFPEGTQYHDKPLPSANIGPRRRWLESAIDNVADSKIVFLDPDKGFGWGHEAKLDRVHDWEVQKLLDLGKIVVVFQFGSHEFERHHRELAKLQPQRQHIRICTWSTTKTVHFYIIGTTDAHTELIESRLETLRQSAFVKNRKIAIRTP